MEIYDLLKEDHKKVKALFRKVEATTERATVTRQELFEKIKTELEVHTTIEEELLYPELRDAEKTHEMILEAIEEHKVVKELLVELANMPVDAENWAAKLKVMIENVEHHVEEEESDLFPKAKKVLSDEEAEDIADRALAMKKDMGL